ncbi:MAG: ABC transporter ATP-binding protein [Chloroflexota bacterium]
MASLTQPETAQWAIAFRAVSLSYPAPGTDVLALDSVSFEAPRGDVTAITGPSGSGKTTLLNIAGGLERPTAGEVVVLGTHLEGLEDAQLTAFRAACVGMVFQEPHLLPGLSALDNVVAVGIPRGSWERLLPEARELLVAVGLEARLDFVPGRLSAGERQRVSLARALLGERPVLLADEPTGNLDAATTDDLMGLLLQLREERRLTLVIATHDPTVAAYADRIIRLVSGRIVRNQLVAEGRAVEQHELHD